MNCVDLQRSLAGVEDLSTIGHTAGQTAGQTAEHTEELQAHLKSCAACSALVAELDLIASSAPELRAAEEPSPRIWNSIESALRREGLIRPQTIRPFVVSKIVVSKICRVKACRFKAFSSNGSVARGFIPRRSLPRHCGRCVTRLLVIRRGLGLAGLAGARGRGDADRGWILRQPTLAVASTDAAHRSGSGFSAGRRKLGRLEPGWPERRRSAAGDQESES